MKYDGLTDTQQHVFFEIMNFFINSDEKVYILNGVAGSGKSSLIKVLQEEIISLGGRGRILSYTGKATSNLLNKSVRGATTIHNLLYFTEYSIDKQGNEILVYKKQDVNVIRSMVDLIIVDESSMVPEDIYYDLLELGKKILFIGDNNQLPPISTSGFNIMSTNNFNLQEIHRQDGMSPIIPFSFNVLKTGKINTRFDDGKNIKIINKNEVNRKFLKNNDFDIILCGKNVTRERMNRLVREISGYTSDYPELGETIISLKNMKNQAIYNGQMFVIGAQHRSERDKSTQYKLHDKFQDIRLQKFNTYLDVPDFVWDGAETPKSAYYNECPMVDYGYALTVHKSQGSEFNNVLFINEDVSSFTNQTKFMYTAITRTRKSITIAV